MQLQRKQAVGSTGFSIAIDHLSRFHIVDVVSQIEITRNDTVAVPVLLFDGLGDICILGEFLDLFLQLAVVPNC